jgi:hypothetical protein
MSESLIIKLGFVGIAAFLGGGLSILASLLIENGKWDALSPRSRWGARLVGFGISVVVALTYLASIDQLTERTIFGMLAASSALSFAGMTGYRVLLRKVKGGPE